jgi:hypothetical protein
LNRTLEYHSKYLSSSRPTNKTLRGHDVYAMWLSNPDVPPYFYTLHSAHYLVEWIVSCPRVQLACALGQIQPCKSPSEVHKSNSYPVTKTQDDSPKILNLQTTHRVFVQFTLALAQRSVTWAGGHPIESASCQWPNHRTSPTLNYLSGSEIEIPAWNATPDAHP